MKHSRLVAWLLGFPGLLLAIAFILISMHQNNLVQNHQANDFTFEKDVLCIKGTGLSDKLAYSSMKKIECVNKVETVRPVDESYFNGIVETKKYGDARVYVYPHTKKYIVIHTPKKIYIINEYSVSKTEKLYRELKQH